MVDYCERMVGETNPGVLEQANRTECPHAGDHGYRTIGDIMRALNPFTGEFYREALQVSRYTREMFCLMEGRHVHPSTLYPGGVGTVATIQLMTDYLSRLMRYVEFMQEGRADARRPLRLLLRGAAGVRAGRVAAHAARLLGLVPGPAGLQLRLQGHDPMGPGHVRQSRRRGRRQADHQRPGRHQPRHPHPARLVVLRRLGTPGDVRHEGPAGQPGGSAAPLEPAHQPASAEAGHGRQVLLGDEPALVRRPRSSRAGHRGRARSPGSGRRRWAGWSTPAATSSPPGTACRSTCRRPR